MSYDLIGWVNDESALSAENFNHMDEGIKKANDLADKNASDIAEFANEQIPEEYVRSAVDTYIEENEAGLALKEEVEALDAKIDAEVSSLSSEIVENNNDFSNGYGYKTDSISGQFISSKINLLKNGIKKNSATYGNVGSTPVYEENENFFVSEPIELVGEMLTVYFPDTLSTLPSAYKPIQLLDENGLVLSNTSYTALSNIKNYPSSPMWHCVDNYEGYYTIKVDAMKSGYPTVKYIVLCFPMSDIDSAYVYSDITKELEWLELKNNSVSYEKLTDEATKNVRVFEPKVSMLNKYYAVVGKELNLYFNSLYNFVDWKVANIYPQAHYTGDGLKMYDDRISIVPTQSGTFKLNLWSNVLYENERIIFKHTEVTIEVVADIELSTVKKALFIGDSRTDNGNLTSYVKEIFGDKIDLIGTRGEGDNRHEGRSGWSAEQYCSVASVGSVANPFWNGSNFDFAYYMSQNGYSNLDYVNIMLGANDMYSDNAINSIKTMVNSIRAYNSNIVISLMIDYPLSMSAYYTSAFVRRLLAQQFFAKMVVAFGGRESENIYLLPTNTALSDEFDFNKGKTNASLLNPTEVEVIADNLHPNTYGYKKLSNEWIVFIQWIN